MKQEKDHYKNNFSQAEDPANDEEQGYRAEAEAFEKLRNEYNLNVKELEILERDKIQILCIIERLREDQSPTMAKDY